MKKLILLAGVLIASLSLASELSPVEFDETNWVDKKQTIQELMDDFASFLAQYYPTENQSVCDELKQAFEANIQDRLSPYPRPIELANGLWAYEQVDLAKALWAYENAKEEVCPDACYRERTGLDPQNAPERWHANFSRGVTDFCSTMEERYISSADSLCVSSTGDIIALLNGNYNAAGGPLRIRSIDMSTDTHEKQDLHNYGQRQFFNHIAVSPENDAFALSANYYDSDGSWNSSISLQSQKEQKIRNLTRVKGMVKHISYTANGLYLIAKTNHLGTAQTFNYLLDAQTGELIKDRNVLNYYFPRKLIPPRNALTKDPIYAHSYDNTMIAVSTPNADGTYSIVLHDNSSGDNSGVTIEHPWIKINRKVDALALSRDKRKLAVVSHDAKTRALASESNIYKSRYINNSADTIEIFYLDGSRDAKTIECEDGGYYIHNLNFSPDGNDVVYRSASFKPLNYEIVVQPVEEQEERSPF